MSVILAELWEVTLVIQLMSQPTDCCNLTAHHIKIYCLPHTGMNLTLVKKLLQHDGLCQLLEHAGNNGQKALIHVHCGIDTTFWK